MSDAFRADPPFATFRKLRTPPLARWFSRVLLVAFVASPFVLMSVPWQQTVRGRGQIVAFSPTERKQVVTARVSGLIQKWYVQEGSRVKVGDPVVDIEDNDPDLADRLNEQLEFLKSRKQEGKLIVKQLEQGVKATIDAQRAEIVAAEAKRDAAGKEVVAATMDKANTVFAVTFEKMKYGMFTDLVRDQATGGLESRLNMNEAKLKYDRAETDVAKAEAGIAKADAELKNADAVVRKAEASAVSALASAETSLGKAKQDLFGIEQSLQELDSRIARFEARHIKSATAGTVFRIFANVAEGGQYVKEGDELAVIVPESDDRVVELLIDGVDAPLISAHMEAKGIGPHVRLQFEGWPGVQFTGWPSVAVGTYGGRIRQMDPHDDGYGRFRVLVEPEHKYAGDDDWPEAIYLRQGNQAIGWVFLNRVTLGYELWRQLNGFPPVVAPKPPDKKDSRKPPKIKVG